MDRENERVRFDRLLVMKAIVSGQQERCFLGGGAGQGGPLETEMARIKGLVASPPIAEEAGMSGVASSLGSS